MEIQGKYTKGDDRATRDAWVLGRVQRDVRRFSRECDQTTDEPWISVSTPSVRRWVSEAADAVAEETGNDRWFEVSSHDFQRSWATYHLVEQG